MRVAAYRSAQRVLVLVMGIGIGCARGELAFERKPANDAARPDSAGSDAGDNRDGSLDVDAAADANVEGTGDRGASSDDATIDYVDAAGIDAQPDSRPDLAPDTGPDAARDVGPDAIPDAAPETPAAVDAAPDGPPACGVSTNCGTYWISTGEDDCGKTMCGRPCAVCHRNPFISGSCIDVALNKVCVTSCSNC